MHYNDRVTIIRKETEPGYLGDDVAKEVRTVLPCQRGQLTDRQQMGIFGKYNLAAFKLHIQGIHSDIEEIEYQGKRRMVQGVLYHRNSTVVIVQ